MAEEPTKAASQFQGEIIHRDIGDASAPDTANWKRYLEVKVVTGVFVALIANGLRALVTLLNRRNELGVKL